MKTNVTWPFVALMVVLGAVVGCGEVDESDGNANSAKNGDPNGHYGGYYDTVSEGDMSSSYNPGAPNRTGDEQYEQGVSYDTVAYADVMEGDIYEGEDPQPNNEQYGEWIENDFIETNDEPVSTFSLDVDTGSYTIARGKLLSGLLPHQDSVRVEEFINYFRYDYPQPEEHPVSVNMEMGPSFFGTDLHMLRIGIKGYEVPEEERKAANLVFLVDVSGSMGSGNKLPLVKYLLTQLVEVLEPDDRLGIVTYAGSFGTLLPSTAVENKSQIQAAIASLSSGGSTNGAGGIMAAYEMAEENFIDGGINRVILCTDGDFNVGLTGDSLIDMIEESRESDVTLSVFSFGWGNLNDHYMEQLADHGNGNYGYIDSQEEADHVVNNKLMATLQVIAKDVKVQVEFNPLNVLRYRLVGYENRLLQNEDFDDDTVDAAEIGSGHTVTALYEVELAPEASEGRVSQCRFRYKRPNGDVSTKITQDVFVEDVLTSFQDASDSYQFVTAVTEFAEILRDSKHSDGARFDDVYSIAIEAANSLHPEQLEFLELVQIAEGLWD